MADNSLFTNITLDKNKLIQYGFKPIDNKMIYIVPLKSAEFDLEITVNTNCQLIDKLYDRETKDIYPLYKNPDTVGAFIGKIRTECSEILRQIADKCGHIQIFKTRQAQLIGKYINEKYQNQLEYLWPKTPNNAIFRRQDNAKWYGVILTVACNKLGIKGDEIEEVLNLRGIPEEIQQLITKDPYYPAYHMNKKSWLTIRLNDTLSDEELLKRIDESYILAAHKKTAHKK